MASLFLEIKDAFNNSWNIFPFGVIIYLVIFIISLRLFVASIKNANFSDTITAFLSGAVAFLVIIYCIPLTCISEKISVLNIASFMIGICGCISIYYLQMIYDWEEY
ncbi:MAG: hypothetical protein IPN15_09110 [Saprospiraceae bacterium]|nr:hypothetical protein [Bacteroidota bacterium]MBK7694785.1 hypothetical protein [Candidatus Vicinibacter affinis]MBK8642353.1 hypothetical protein [Candidatus Vicinibacter affinis]